MAMSDFTEKCEKKEKRSGIKTLYLKKSKELNNIV